MEAIQFINYTPEQLQEEILKGIKTHLETILSGFQPKQDDEYLTRNEVAKLLKVDVSTVHNWTKSGRLKKYGFGNKVYYLKSEIKLVPIDE